jgi:cation diffusion facilitator CzcD-associated flavoprotein CzcO
MLLLLLLLLLLLDVEIFKYQRHCVDKYGLAPHIRLSTCVTAAAFDAGSGSWSITTSAGDTVTARVLVLAQGTWCFVSGVFALCHRGLCM